MRQLFNHEKYVELYSEELSENKLSEQMSVTASQIAFYGHQEIIWQGAADALKHQYEVETASLRVDLRDSGTKYTADALKDKSEVDETAQKTWRGHLKATEQKKLYGTAREALEKRAQLLQSMGSNKRSEMAVGGAGMYTPTDDGYYRSGTPGLSRGAYTPTASPAVMPYGYAGDVKTSLTPAMSKLDEAKREEILKMLGAVKSTRPDDDKIV